MVSSEKWEKTLRWAWYQSTYLPRYLPGYGPCHYDVKGSSAYQMSTWNRAFSGQAIPKMETLDQSGNIKMEIAAGIVIRVIE